MWMCVYVCVHVDGCIRMCTCGWVYTYVYMWMGVYVCVHVDGVYVCVHVDGVYVCVHVMYLQFDLYFIFNFPNKLYSQHHIMHI